MHGYRGIGRLPKSLAGSPAGLRHRLLLDSLPKLLRGYGRTPGIDAIVVVIDADRTDCTVLLQQLTQLADSVENKPTTLFRIAIEETEAWYFGDKQAIVKAYPRAKPAILDRYQQDAICETWEMLADAIHSGGASAVKRQGWPLPGNLKHQWAKEIGPHMDPEINQSPSFKKLRDGLRRLVSIPSNAQKRF